MDTERYKKLFLEEAREHLSGMSKGFLVLEKAPGSLEGVDELFRHAHSMKGMASSMGYDQITALSHAMEDVLDGLRGGKVTPGPELVDLLLSALDQVERMVGEVESNDLITTVVDDLVATLRAGSGAAEPAVETGDEGDLEELLPECEPSPESGSSGEAPDVSRVLELLKGLGPGQASMAAEFLAGGLTPYQVRVGIETESPAPGARNFVVLNRLGEIGVNVVSVPDAAAVKRGESSHEMEALLLSSESLEAVGKLLESVPEVRDVTVAELPRASLEEALCASAVEAAAPPAAVDAGFLKKAKTVRVDCGILDRLINIVGEMIISHDRVRQESDGLGSEDLGEEIGKLGGYIQRLQETVMGVRMMPLDLVAGRFPRMVRDLARSENKDVRFEVVGSEIELDRSVLEEVGEVLVHLLRNAVDHGIESPETRSSEGKPPEGRITFKAYREKDWVFIQVSDDGRGIDVAKVRAKALERGLVSPEVLEMMHPEDILMLTTTPGFSTADEVTSVSGRGVGLDAVRAKVEALGGSLALYSVAGRGATVTVKVPLSLAIVQLLMVSAGGQTFGLPVTRVQSIAELLPDMLRVAGSRNYFRQGRSLVRLDSLSELLGLKEAAVEWSGPVVVMERGRRRFGFLVDALLGTRDAVVKPLGLPLMRVPALAGATILGDGRPVFIVDPLRLAGRLS